MHISVIIRTLNERESLKKPLDAIEAQKVAATVEVIIVDNESTDGTRDLALARNCKLVTLARDSFTYPRSINAGAEVATGELLVFLVGHAQITHNLWLQTAVLHLENPKVAGVYSEVLPLKECTIPEIFFYYPNYLYAKIRGPYRVMSASPGVLGLTNIAIPKRLWDEHPFDERFECGGEDGEWARWALNEKGLDIVCDWRFAVRHSHGLGVLGLIKQLRYWFSLGKPTKFDRKKIAYRNDIRF
jgi:glycosyltransferase involved in cell wall biosynthesis